MTYIYIYVYIGEVSQYGYKAFYRLEKKSLSAPNKNIYIYISQTNLRRQDVDLQVYSNLLASQETTVPCRPTNSDSSSFFPTKSEGNQREDFTTPREGSLQQVTGQSCSAPSGILYTNRKSKLPDFRGVIWTLDDVVTRQSHAIY